jgi:hypothetical protein
MPVGEIGTLSPPCGSPLLAACSQGAIPQQQYHFKPIAALESVEAGNMCDVVGVVERVDNWQVGQADTSRAVRD